jgi:hypothetical protein
VDEQTLRLLQTLRLNSLTLTGRLRAQVDTFLDRRWSAMDSWRDEDMAKLLNDVIPYMTAAERQMVDLTNANLASAEAAASGSTFRPRPPRYQDLTGAALRGVEPDALYMRAQMVLNYHLARGKSLTDAVTAGGNRLRSLGATNLQLAKTKTAAAQGRAPFYRRVLTGSENCALCVIASTQRYRLGALQPIHPGCDCGVEQIVDAQPAHVIDRDLLDSTHAEIDRRLGATDRNAQDLDLSDGRKTSSRGKPLSDFTDLIATRQHGELGPVLTWRGDHFRGPIEADGLAA